ncbi:MAG: hypothetical protein AABX16_03465 [Nanoarchaeota archaeon]
MSEEKSIGTLVNFIIIVLVLAIVIGGLYYFDVIGNIKDIFPTFGKQNTTVAWEGHYFLERPELIVYEIQDTDDTLFLWYDTALIAVGEKKGQSIGWRWFRDISRDKEGWLTAESYIFTAREYKPFFDRNKNLINALASVQQNPEKGLQKIVERIVKSKEALHVKIGTNWNEVYAANDARLRDLDGLIDKFNQISRGVVREKKI